MIIELNKDQIRDCIACLGFVAHDLENALIKSPLEYLCKRRAKEYTSTADHLQQQMNKGGTR